MQCREKASENGLSIAALIFSILSVLTLWIPFAGTPFAVLALVFALLSRGGKKMNSMSVISVVITLVGVLLSFLIMAGIFVYLIKAMGVMDPEELQQLLNGLLRQYGQGGGL